ncbi:MAG: polyamine-transporting ATPase [Dehalococcoidia bacterium]|nr:MAG: polyamine-transporting ATPase [Dehalococcoidia bacterium]
MMVVEQLSAGSIREVSFTAAPGEVLVLLGPEGAGKRTLLRALGGFEAVRAGRVIVDGEPITALPPGQRPTAFVAHEDSVFGHLSVRENLGFGLRVRGLAADVLAERVEDLATRIGLADQLDRPAATLAPEARWRVALARALAVEPKVVLVDEPVGDATVGLALARTLASRQEATLIAATRERTAALSTADRVAFLRAGRIEQVGPPQDLFYRPRTPFVADYVARANVLECIVEGVSSGVVLVRLFEKRVAVPTGAGGAGQGYTVGERALLVARPEAVRLVHEREAFTGTVRRAAFLGPLVAYEVEVAGCSLSVVDPDARPGRWYPPGSEARLGLIPEALTLLPYPASG